MRDRSYATYGKEKKEMGRTNVLKKYGWLIALLGITCVFALVMAMPRPNLSVSSVVSWFATVMEVQKKGQVIVGPVGLPPTNLRDVLREGYTAGAVIEYADWRFSCGGESALFQKWQKAAFSIRTPCPTDKNSLLQVLKALREHAESQPEGGLLNVWLSHP